MKRKTKFPTMGMLLLAIGVLWLLTELQIIRADVPWWPIVLIIFAIGMIFNRLR
jgi:hypothetical protein